MPWKQSAAGHGKNLQIPGRICMHVGHPTMFPPAIVIPTAPNDKKLVICDRPSNVGRQ